MGTAIYFVKRHPLILGKNNIFTYALLLSSSPLQSKVSRQYLILHRVSRITLQSFLLYPLKLVYETNRCCKLIFVLIIPSDNWLIFKGWNCTGSVILDVSLFIVKIGRRRVMKLKWRIVCQRLNIMQRSHWTWKKCKQSKVNR